MSAFTKIIEFVGKLPEALQPEYRQLIDNYISERDRLQSERIGQNMATTGTFEVVASWYADKLLNDVANPRDIIMLVETNISNSEDARMINEDCINEQDTYTVEWYEEINSVMHYALIGKDYMHPAKYFRKVSTPLYNPHQTVEGC